MIDPDQLCDYVIRPSLQQVGLHSKSAEQLLLGTCCVESAIGTYLKQIGGPALGIYQMEAATHWDCYANYLRYKPDLMAKIRPMIPSGDWDTANQCPQDNLLITDLRYATVMARIKYLRSPVPLPREDDWHECAVMWKSVYNTIHGAGTELKFMDALVTCGVIHA